MVDLGWRDRRAENLQHCSVLLSRFWHRPVKLVSEQMKRWVMARLVRTLAVDAESSERASFGIETAEAAEAKRARTAAEMKDFILKGAWMLEWELEWLIKEAWMLEWKL